MDCEYCFGMGGHEFLKAKTSCGAFCFQTNLWNISLVKPQQTWIMKDIYTVVIEGGFTNTFYFR